MDGKLADAVMYPHGRFMALGAIGNRQAGIVATFGKVMGSAVLWGCPLPFGMDLITKAKAPERRSLLFPAEHPRAGQERYVWHVAVQDAQGNWVLVRPLGSFWEGRGETLIGFCKPDDEAADPRVAAAIRDANEALLLEAAKPENRRRRLDAFLEAGQITAAEHAEQVEQQRLPEVSPPASARDIVYPGGSLGPRG
jgi:hypothetical protein